MTIVFIEDDRAIARAVRDFLADKGCRVSLCPTLAAAREALAGTLPDLVLLDWNLPDGEGAGFCRELRARAPELPVLLLTVRSDTRDILAGFDCGADDYVTKPFDREVLYSRMLALLRRSRGTGGPVLQCAGIVLDENRQAVTCRGRTVGLGQLEYQLLRLLLQNKGRTVTRRPWSKAEAAVAEPWRESLLEHLAEADEPFLDLYLGGEYSLDDVRAALRRATLSRAVTPVLCGSALRNSGVQPVLDAVCDLLPSPLDVPAPVGRDSEGNKVPVPPDAAAPAVVLIFKVLMENGRSWLLPASTQAACTRATP